MGSPPMPEIIGAHHPSQEALRRLKDAVTESNRVIREALRCELIAVALLEARLDKGTDIQPQPNRRH
jgi:hypothetical protein